MSEISPEQRAAYDAAFERWLRYEQEAYKANTHHWSLAPPHVPQPPPPAVAYPREELMRFRQNYVLLRNVVAELLDLNPETMTQGEVFFRMRRRYEDASGREDDVG